MLIKTEHREKIRYHGLNFGREFLKRHIGTHAASIAFFVFLSIVPIIILFASIITYTSLTLERLTEAALDISPDYIDDLLATVITEAYSKSRGLLPLSAAVLMLSSSQGTLAVIRGLNSTYQMIERRNIILLRLISMLYTLMLLGLIAVMVYITFGDYLILYVISPLAGNDLPQAVYSLNHTMISFVLSVLLFALVYTLCPCGRRSYICQLPGAVFTAAGWHVFSYFFSLYMNGANKYTLFYGSLGAVAVFLFWLYCCFYIMLFGGFLNRMFEPQIMKLFGTERKTSKKSEKQQDS